MSTWREMLKKPTFKRPKDYPCDIPLLDIKGAILLPRGQLPTNLQKQHASVIRQAMGTDRLVGVIQSSESPINGAGQNLFQVGCLGRISAFSEGEESQDFVVLTGLIRFRILKHLKTQQGILKAHVTYDPFSFDAIDENESVDDRESFLELVRGYCHLHDLNPNWDEVLKSKDNILLTSLAMMCPFSDQERQALLEMPTLKDQERMMTALMEVACLKGQPNQGSFH